MPERQKRDVGPVEPADRPMSLKTAIARVVEMEPDLELYNDPGRHPTYDERLRGATPARSPRRCADINAKWEPTLNCEAAERQLVGRLCGR